MGEGREIGWRTPEPAPVVTDLQAAEQLLALDTTDGILVDWLITGRVKNLDGSTTNVVVGSEDMDHVVAIGLARIACIRAETRVGGACDGE